MLITNKYKQKTASKKEATRRIRYSAFESAIPAKPKRHDQNVCPVCGKPIEKTASGGRRKHSCSRCGACLNREITCASCGTNRVWQGKRGAFCLGCGAKYHQAPHASTPKSGQSEIDGRKFEEELVTEIPELREELADWLGLDHLVMMEFALFTVQACKREAWKTVERCLRLADRLLRHGDLEVSNAVYVSYLEILPRKGKAHDRLRSMMTTDLRKGWDDILDYLSRL